MASSQNKLIVIIIVAFIVLSVGGFLWQQQSQRSAVHSLLPKDEISQRALPPIISEEKTGWQTYRNEDYGFEIRYPTNLTLVESGKDQGNLFCLEGEKLFDSAYPVSSSLNAQILEIERTEIEAELSQAFRDCLELPGIGRDICEQSHTLQTKELFGREVLIWPSPDSSAGPESRRVWVDLDEHYLMFDSVYDNDLFEQILTTLRFTD